MVGFAATALGFIVTIWQLRKTQSAAKAAENAARAAGAENRFAYEKYTSNRAHRFLQESKIHVDGEVWAKAAIRLSDLTHELHQLMALDSRWNELVDELHTWNVLCYKLDTKKQKRFPQKERWLDFCRRLEVELNKTMGPFAETKGGSK